MWACSTVEQPADKLLSCASIKFFRPKEPAVVPSEDDEGTGGDGDFHGRCPSNATRQSTMDSDARLYRKGKGQSARLCHMRHALIKNRSGMVVSAPVTETAGTAERKAGLESFTSSSYTMTFR